VHRFPPAESPHEIANGEIEADEHHERDKPLIALGRTVRNDKHAAVVEVPRAFPQEGANPAPATMAATNKSLAQMNKAQDMGRATKGCSVISAGRSASVWPQVRAGSVRYILMKKTLLASIAALPLLCAAEAHADDYVPTAQPLSSCAIVNPPNDENWRPGLLNVREEPDLKSKIVRQLKARENIKITGQVGEWVRMSAVMTVHGFSVDMEPSAGWVSRKHLIFMDCPFSSAVRLDPATPEVKRAEWCRDYGYKDAECINQPSATPQPASTVPGPDRDDQAHADPINLPSAMLGSWCFKEGNEVRQTYIRNAGVCLGTLGSPGILIVWPDGYGHSAGTCMVTKIEKLAMNVYSAKSNCRGLPKGQNDGLTWNVTVELSISSMQLKITWVPET